MKPLNFEISRIENCYNSNNEDCGPGYKVVCKFMCEDITAEIPFNYHKKLEEYGVTTKDILSKIFREIPSMSEINEDFIKMFGSSLDETFKEAIEKINNVVYNDYLKKTIEIVNGNNTKIS